MSAFLTLHTPMLDEECLVEAIVELGFPRANLVRSETPIALRGWQNGRSAHVVLRREDTGDGFNDIGFVRSTMGFTAIVSDDNGRYGREWLSRVSATYQSHAAAKQQRLAVEERRRLEEERQRLVEAQRQAVHERARKMGYRVQETREGETVRMVLVKRTY